MENMMDLIGQEYLIITLLGIVVGYVITSTPRLVKMKDNIPIMVTIMGAVLGTTIGGYTLEGLVFGAISGLISTGLYELFGKKLKDLGKEELRSKREYAGDDKHGL